MPVFNKDVAMTAVGFEEDVASRAAQEGSSEGIHPLPTVPNPAAGLGMFGMLPFLDPT